MIPKTMRAVILTEPTPAEQVRLRDCPVPPVRPGWVLVKVKAFGLNHSEQILRLSEIIFTSRSFPASNAWERLRIRRTALFRRGKEWPRSWAAWGEATTAATRSMRCCRRPMCFPWRRDSPGRRWRRFQRRILRLFECLKLQKGDTLLVRGGTCALGYAAIRLAKASGCRVIATTHREKKLSLLAGADRAVLDTGTLADTFSGVTKALELVGPKTLRDTLKCVEKGGIVCSTGIIGGVYALHGFDPIKEIPNGVYLTGFFSNDPTRQAMTDIFSFIDEHEIKPDIGAVYRFENISAALLDRDHHRVEGKIVIEV